ncbi:MAG: hypothetical protein NTV80_20535 [Verrucomicrobia bacterium]|nr:hypothetical protein [Verrucomicrobiota bacterium]
MKNTVLITLSIALIIAIVVFTQDGMSGMFLNEAEQSHPVWPGLVMAAAMLAGIVSGRLHDNISSAKRFKIGKLFADLPSDKDLWKSLLASPIVFGVVYSLLSKSNDFVVCAVFSFQNGFFCDVILKKKQDEMEAQKPSKEPAA